MIRKMGIKERVKLSGEALDDYPRWIEENNIFQGGGVKREEAAPALSASGSSVEISKGGGLSKKVRR